MLRRPLKNLVKALPIFALLILWEIVPPFFHVPELLFPRLSVVVARFFADFPSIEFNSAITGTALLYGFLIAAVFGAVLALVVSYVEWLRGALEPVILTSQVIPKVALVPLLLTWVGLGLESKTIITAIIAFFPVYEGLRTGVRRVNPDILLQARLLGQSELSQLLFIRVPFAMPGLFVGLKTSALYAVIGVVVAEFLASGDGIGFSIVDRMGRSDTVGAFAYIAAITLIGLVGYYAIAIVEAFVLSMLRLRRDHTIL